MAIKLQFNSKSHIKKLEEELRFREIRIIRHNFTKKRLSKLKTGESEF